MDQDSNREFGQKIKFDFGMSVFTFVRFCNAKVHFSGSGIFAEIHEDLYLQNIAKTDKVETLIPKSSLIFCLSSLA